MEKKRNPGRAGLTDQQISEIKRLRRQGKSILAIAKATGCHRQTVRVYLKELKTDILADEVRKELLTDELRRHVDAVIGFAVPLAGSLPVRGSPFELPDAATVVQHLFCPPGVAKGLEYKRKVRQNRMLFESLRQHTGEKVAWWQAFEEWEKAWDTCNRSLEELRGEADEVVGDLLNNQKPGLKEAVERESGKKGAVERIGHDVLWVVWWAGTRDSPAEEYYFRIKDGQLEAVVGDGTFPLRLKLDSPSPEELLRLCKLAFETLYQSFVAKHIPEVLYEMEAKIQQIDDNLDSFILRPLILRTRCYLCPA